MKSSFVSEGKAFVQESRGPRGVVCRPRDLSGLRPVFEKSNVLVLIPSRGAVLQETLDPIALLKSQGAKVRIGTLDGSAPEIEPFGKLMSAASSLWNPSWGFYRDSIEQQWLSRDVMNLTEWAQAPRAMEDPLAAFDVLIVPGGFGPGLVEFLKHKTVHEVIRAATKLDRLVALQCHSVILAELVQLGGNALFRDRRVVCWPRAWERPMGHLPFVGKYFMPFGQPVQDAIERSNDVHFENSLLMAPHACIDGNLVTSVGPWSTRHLVTAIGAALEGRSRRRP